MFAKRILAVACATLCTHASAMAVLDFTGVGNGAMVNDFYNGGTDSMGNAGPNYGVHFSGGQVIYNADGPLLSGGFSMTISQLPVAVNANGDYGLSFLASWSGSGSDVTHIRFYTADSPARLYDDISIGGNGNPYCSTKAECDAKGYNWIDPQFMGGQFLMVPSTVNRIDFGTSYVDDIVFGATGRPANRPAPASSVPEPATLALLGLGMFGTLAARRRRQALYCCAGRRSTMRFPTDICTGWPC